MIRESVSRGEDVLEQQGDNHPAGDDGQVEQHPEGDPAWEFCVEQDGEAETDQDLQWDREGRVCGGVGEGIDEDGILECATVVLESHPGTRHAGRDVPVPEAEQERLDGRVDHHEDVEREAGKDEGVGGAMARRLPAVATRCRDRRDPKPAVRGGATVLWGVDMAVVFSSLVELSQQGVRLRGRLIERLLDRLVAANRRSNLVLHDRVDLRPGRCRRTGLGGLELFDELRVVRVDRRELRAEVGQDRHLTDLRHGELANPRTRGSA